MNKVEQLLKEVVSEMAKECDCDTRAPGVDVIDEVTPPGKEKVVRALKKKKGVKNPWAVAWAQYDKEHHKK